MTLTVPFFFFLSSLHKSKVSVCNLSFITNSTCSQGLPKANYMTNWPNVLEPVPVWLWRKFHGLENGGTGEKEWRGSSRGDLHGGDQGQTCNFNSQNQLLSVGEEGTLMKCFAHSQDFFRQEPAQTTLRSSMTAAFVSTTQCK